MVINMKYLIWSLIGLNIFFIIVMGIYDHKYDKNIDKLDNKINTLEQEISLYRKEEVLEYLTRYLNMEIQNLQEKLINDKYYIYTYDINEEEQLVVLDKNYNLIALNPDNLDSYK